MPRLALALFLLALLLSAPAQAGPNVSLCLVMEKNYGDCLERQQRRERHWRREREEWDDDELWDGPPPQDEDCSAWLVQLKANGCF
jgi:hypothetical protein